MKLAIHTALRAGVVVGIVVSAVVWMLPVELAVDLAVSWSTGSTLAEFERAERAEAVWMLCRAAGPLLLISSLVAKRRGHAILAAQELIKGWREATTVTESIKCSTPDAPVGTSRSLTTLVRMCVLSSIGLAVLHAGACLGRRIEDWPVYRLNSGHTVLPNISQQNRDVIHYLQSVTPSDCRLFVIIDQKLYFLSYYVLPRRVFHLTHPNAEFRIPAGYGAHTIPTLLEVDEPGRATPWRRRVTPDTRNRPVCRAGPGANWPMGLAPKSSARV
jgi:hypothetical protein